MSALDKVRERPDDKDVVLAAVAQYGFALTLQDAAPAMKEDKDVVLAAVAQNGYALKYAAPAYRGAVVAAVVLGAAAAGLFFFRRRTSR